MIASLALGDRVREVERQLAIAQKQASDYAEELERHATDRVTQRKRLAEALAAKERADAACAEVCKSLRAILVHVESDKITRIQSQCTLCYSYRKLGWDALGKSPDSRILSALAAGDKLADKARAILNELATCGEPDADRTEMMVNELEEAESTYRQSRKRGGGE